MSLQIADNFSYKGKKPLDARLVCNDIPDILALPTSTIYDGIIVYAVAQKKFYTYDSNNTVDATLQKWRELTTAGILIQSATIDNVTTSATKGHLILTMSDGTTIDCGNAVGDKGDKGDKGDGFAIIKLYTNVSDMTSDATPVSDGQMVAVIDNTTSPITAKVYIRNSSQTHDSTGNENGYTFFCNLADATVIQGPKGPQGPQGPKGDNGSTPVITITNVPATATKPEGKKITFTTGSGATATTASTTIYNGINLQSAAFNASDELILTLTDGSTINLGKLPGTGTGSCITMLGCFDTAPTTFVQDDIYYNNLDGLIYKSPDGTTWGTGTQPEKDILYISMNDHKIYSYTNNTFEVYGGGGSSVSSKSGNAIQEITGSSTPSENGIYVEDLRPEFNKLNYAQKIVNKPGREELISAPISLPKFTKPTTDGTSVMTNLGITIALNNDINNYEYIDISLQPSSTSRKRIPQIIRFRVDDIVYNNTTSENATDGSMILLHYDVDTTNGYGGQYHMNIKAWFKDNINLYLFQGSTSIADERWRDWVITNITGVITESTIINPVEYVDSTKGIEDTPVGEIITKIGSTKIPAHYLACDGSTHNIADYPELAQCIKDEFGSFNYYGGDGVTTFAVPNYNSFSWWQPTLVKGLIPRPYSVLVSSSYNTTQYQKELMFDGIISIDSCWHSAADGSDTNIWVKFDFGSNTCINGLRMAARPGYLFQLPSTFTIEGSNDDVTYTVIKSYSGLPTPASTAFREHIFDKPVNYRYYKLNHITSNAKNDGYDYCSISELEFSKVDSMSYIKYEPTYYMELNQDAYVNEYCDTYSTDEKIVGKWTDGKPVYRKVVPVTLPSKEGSTSTAHGISNMDTLVNYSLTWYDTSDGAWYDRFRLWESTYGIAMEMTINRTNIIILTNKTNTINWTSRTSKAYSILEYTKTTDAPNSFDYGMIMDQFAQEALVDVAVTDAEVDKCFE